MQDMRNLKNESSRAPYISWFTPEVTDDVDVHKSLKEQLSFKNLVCTRLKNTFYSYFSFLRSRGNLVGITKSYGLDD
jgi:hypothetical protein